MLNRVMIIGRLGQDPQLKYSQAGMPIATFSVATDETFTDRDGIRQQRTEWFRVVVFQKVAENCARYLHKGSLVYVEGSLQTRKWQDQNGVDHTLVEIRAQRVDFLEKRPAAEDYGRRSYAAGESEPFASYEPAETPRPSQDYTRSSQANSYQPQESRKPVFPPDALGEDVPQMDGGEIENQEYSQPNPEESKIDKVPF